MKRGITYKRLEREMLEFLNKWFDNDLGDTVLRTGKDAKLYSECVGDNTVMWISMDGSPMYELMNYGEDRWRFQDAFSKFLEERGFWYEMGHAWNMNIYRKEY